MTTDTLHFIGVVVYTGFVLAFTYASIAGLIEGLKQKKLNDQMLYVNRKYDDIALVFNWVLCWASVILLTVLGNVLIKYFGLN